jgi:vacuolar-type H+-ATPase subunit H
VNSFQSSIPYLTRSFHQSRIWRAEEQKKETETAAQDAVSESSGTTSEPLGQSEGVSTSETTTTPSSSTTSSGQDALSESSGTTSEPVGQSEHQSKPVLEQASEIAEKAKDTVSDAAAKAAQAVGEFTQQPKERAQDAAASATEQASQIASKVSEQTSETASKLNQQASEATSQVSEQAQSAAAEATRYARNTAASTRETFQERRPYDSRPPAPPSKILYIGNLFFEVTAPQLEAEFAKYGEVTNSRVVTDDRGLSKGFAYVEFLNQQQADAAREALDQKVFQGRRISVQYHRRREANNNSRDNKRNQKSSAEPSKTLFIGNMSYQMSDRDLNGKKCRATSCLVNEY